jgi:ABC-type sugar transport system ATPase subunit
MIESRVSDTSPPGPAPSGAADLALELVGIEKNFGGVKALRGANLSVRRGEIMGLCGENGAGKSTLIKVLAGVHPYSSYRGTVTVNGVVRGLLGPADAIRAGIAVVHQELMLVPELSVAENLMLGREPRRFGLLDGASLEAAAVRQLKRFGFGEQIDPRKPVAELGIGLQQIVEIVRALSLDARILVLDEPTAALSANETNLLLSWLRMLRENGTTCIYVSHRLDEVFAICDRVTVLRDGRTTALLATGESTPEQVVELMVGRKVERTVQPLSFFTPRDEAPVLSVVDLSVRAPRATNQRTSAVGNASRFAIEQVSLQVRRGEIVAVCGAMGSGRTALLSTLFGCAEGPVTGGVSVGGRALTLDSPHTAIRSGIAFVPEDRKRLGLVLGMTVAENLALPSLASSDAMGPSARWGWVDAVSESSLAEKRIRALRIRGEALAPVSTLSGGNQQKVVVGKWLEQPPKLLLLDEPTRGVDVGAREEIYAILEDLAARGVAILLASSDLIEVLRLADRILVLRQGRLVAELDGGSASEEAIVRLSTGAGLGPLAPSGETREASVPS